MVSIFYYKKDLIYVLFVGLATNVVSKDEGFRQKTPGSLCDLGQIQQNRNPNFAVPLITLNLFIASGLGPERFFRGDSNLWYCGRFGEIFSLRFFVRRRKLAIHLGITRQKIIRFGRTSVTKSKIFLVSLSYPIPAKKVKTQTNLDGAELQRKFSCIEKLKIR